MKNVPDPIWKKEEGFIKRENKIWSEMERWGIGRPLRMAFLKYRSNLTKKKYFKHWNSNSELGNFNFYKWL